MERKRNPPRVYTRRDSTMHCTLLIPDLIWPRENADAVVRGLELPALTLLLARARAERFPAIGVEGWLCQAFEVERQRDWPIAPLTLELDGGEPSDAYWLRADPVHIKVERDRLALIDSALFDVTADESKSLASALAEHFSADGIAFHAPAPKRWYVRAAHAPDIATQGVREVAGQDVQRYLPEGADALHWHRVFNEAQMLLHSHPVNAAREERGEPELNSIWLWGGGTRPDVPGRPFEYVWSDDATATALGAAADAHTAPLPADAAAWLSAAATGAGSTHLVMLDTLSGSFAYRDAESWRERLAALEARWLAPLAAALRARRLSGLALVVPHTAACLRFDLARADLLKFWRSAKPMSAYG